MSDQIQNNQVQNDKVQNDRESKHEMQHKAVSREFTVLSFLWRFAVSLILVLATYNPSGYSFFHWVTETDSLGAEHFVVGMILTIGWVILFAATKRSLNTLGMILGVLLLAGLVWLLIDVGLLSLDSVTATTWVILICISALLAVGLCWSHIWRRLTGQFEVDDE
jgi:hypothetical protein